MNTKLLLFLLSFSIIFISCKNDDDNDTRPPLEQLPPLTFTGEGTFGCLINGEPFIDNNLDGVFYQTVGGEKYFGLQANKNNSYITSISFGTQALAITEGQTYQLDVLGEGNFTGKVIFEKDLGDFELIYTDLNNPSYITIDKFDEENRIISGTFEIQVVDPYTNQLIEITDGRFDAPYGQ